MKHRGGHRRTTISNQIKAVSLGLTGAAIHQVIETADQHVTSAVAHHLPGPGGVAVSLTVGVAGTLATGIAAGEVDLFSGSIGRRDELPLLVPYPKRTSERTRTASKRDRVEKQIGAVAGAVGDNASRASGIDPVLAAVLGLTGRATRDVVERHAGRESRAEHERAESAKDVQIGRLLQKVERLEAALTDSQARIAALEAGPEQKQSARPVRIGPSDVVHSVADRASKLGRRTSPLAPRQQRSSVEQMRSVSGVRDRTGSFRRRIGRTQTPSVTQRAARAERQVGRDAGGPTLER